MATSATCAIRPQAPARNRPVGKMASSTATVMGRKAPKRLRNHSAAFTPGNASSAVMP